MKKPKPEGVDELGCLSEVAYTLAHKVNNWLTIASGNAQIVAMRRKQGKVSIDDLPKIQQISERIELAAGALQRLMKLSKQMEDEIRLVKITEVVTNTIESLKEHHSFEKIQVETQVNPECKILGNPKLLGQLFLELLDNAWQAMQGQGKIRISCEPMGDHVQVVVEDNGAGIAAVIAEKIFQPCCTTQQGKAGLGLYLIQQIISAHGGKIRWESEVGKGTKFILEFPRWEMKEMEGAG